MSITVYSVFTTIVWSSLFCIISFFCRRFFIGYFSVGALVAMFACCIFRLLFAVEFTGVRVINLPNVLNPIHDFFYATVLDPYSVLHIFMFIWIAVTMVILCRYMVFTLHMPRNYRK